MAVFLYVHCAETLQKTMIERNERISLFIDTRRIMLIISSTGQAVLCPIPLNDGGYALLASAFSEPYS